MPTAGWRNSQPYDQGFIKVSQWWVLISFVATRYSGQFFFLKGIFEALWEGGLGPKGFPMMDLIQLFFSRTAVGQLHRDS